MSGVCTNLRLKQRSPTTRIGTASRSPKDAGAFMPGPADYQDPHRMSTLTGTHMEDSRLRGVPGYVIGTASRGGLAPEGGPGPSSYSPQASGLGPKSPSAAFGRDARTHASPDSVPGPGAHTVSTAFTTGASPRQVIGTAQRFQQGEGEHATPGPGAYATHPVDPTRPQSARQVIGTAQRPSLAPASLGPGPAYSPSHAHTLPSSPGYSVGRAARGGAAASDSPGPGRYAAELHTGAVLPSSPRQPMAAAPRFSPNPSASDIGPGAYSLQHTGSIPGGALPRAQRSPIAGAQEGPGVAYAHTAAGASTRPRSARAAFGQDSRFKPSGAGDSPSAASYAVNLSAVTASPARTLIGRAARGGQGGGQDSPGPGAYAVERLDSLGALSSSSTRTNAPRQSIGSARRDGGAGAPTSPGPVYSPNTAYVLPRSAGFAMPRSGREGQGGGGGPGPADYGAQAGSYVKPSSPKVAIGTAARFPGSGDREGLAPGPGAYVVEGHNFIAGGTLTRSQRPALSPASGGPGPGQYSPFSTALLPGSGSPASFTRDPRFQGGSSAGDAPGPGAHDTAAGFSYLLPQSPRSVMGRAAREGPGGEDMSGVPLYNSSVAATRPTSPRQPIGSAPRFAERGEATPGPGAFLGPASTRSGPAFTIRGER